MMKIRPGLEKGRIFFFKIINGEGEANDGFALVGYYATAVAALFITREFDAAFQAKRVQLSLYCFDKWLRFSELLDCYDACVKRRGRFERTRDGKAEANLVSA